MHVTIINEAGYLEATLGLSLSYNCDLDEMYRVMKRLACKGGGHNKFLESMIVWLDVTAPRHWWQQFDSYRVGVTKQSSSTMHTLTDRPLTQADFETSISEVTLRRLNNLMIQRDLLVLKNELPEGFLQRRIVCTNYKTLRNIVAQRKNHKNVVWGEFCSEILRQSLFPEFIEAKEVR